jgi:hypothetical protein
MRQAEAACRHVAQTLVAALSEKELLRLRASKQAVIDKVAAALLDNFRQEEALEKEAERLAESHLRTAQELDRHKVIQLIKQRLAEERKFVL